MTPEEKAKELVDHFMDLSEEREYNTPRYMAKEMAIKCALISVNEIKTLLYNSDSMNQYDYWYEVKQEINKL